MPNRFATTLIVLLYLLCHQVAVVRAEHFKISTPNFPPYSDVKNRERPGYSTEVVRAVIGRMGHTAEIQQHPWARATRNVFEGVDDAVFSAFYNKERARNCYYPEEPLITIRVLLFIRSEDEGRLRFDSFEDLRGRQVGIVRGGGYEKAFLKFIRENNLVQEVTTSELNLRKLLRKRVDYIAVEYGQALILMRRLNVMNDVVPLLSRPIMEEDVYLIFSKKSTSPELAEQFSEALKGFKRTTEFLEIHEKYFSPRVARN